jgi:hypothetical protein
LSDSSIGSFNRSTFALPALLHPSKEEPQPSFSGGRQTGRQE